MKLIKSTGILTGVLTVVMIASPLSAQQGTKVALLDISHIFQNNDRFKATMESMKADIEKFEEYVKTRRESLKAKAEGLKRWEVGSAEYRRDETALAKESADLQVEIGLKKKDIMEREAVVYYQAYTEIVQHVSAISRQYNIGLVLRYNGNPIDRNDRNSVLAGVNRSIVYQNQLDITTIVLTSINGHAAPTGTVPAVSRQQIPVRTTPR